jgi:hypothetical protein
MTDFREQRKRMAVVRLLLTCTNTPRRMAAPLNPAIETREIVGIWKIRQ